jgi:metallo-beta-lactamase class B
MTPRCATPLVSCLLVAAILHVAVEGQQAGPAPGETLSQSYRGSQSRNVEYQKIAPFKVFDNLYYVGPGSVAVWLIPTTDGLILVDSAQEPLVDHVAESIRRVGFDPRNIRYILVSHGHLDHFGGIGKLQALSGARVGALEEDWTLIENVYRNAAQGGANRDPGVAFKRDLVLREGDTVALGGTRLKVHRLPGHTAGSPAFDFTVYDNGRSHTALLWSGTAPRNGVEGGVQFLDTLRRVKREFAHVEVPLFGHSWLNSYPYPGSGGAILERAMALRQREAGAPHPFVDNASWRQWLDIAEAGTTQYVADARAKAGARR